MEFWVGVAEADEWDGPLCLHEQPDARCLDLSDANPEVAADYELNIQEYAAAGLAKKYGVKGAIEDWARLCARCRNEFAKNNHAALGFDLECLHKAIAQDSRLAQTQIREVAHAEHLVNDLERWLQEIVLSAGQQCVAPNGFIYAVSNGEAIKIGWSSRHPGSARGRLMDLQIASHLELNLIGAIVGTRSEEQSLHLRFAGHRLRGEWFAAVPEILQHFGAPQA